MHRLRLRHLLQTSGSGRIRLNHPATRLGNDQDIYKRSGQRFALPGRVDL